MTTIATVQTAQEVTAKAWFDESLKTEGVEQALAAQNAVSETGELSDEQLEAVAGGKNEGEKRRK